MTEKDEAGPPTKAGSLRLISGKTLGSCTEPGRSGWLVIVMMASFNQMKEIKPWKGKHCKRRWWYKHKEIHVIMIILCNLHCLMPHKSIGFVCVETLSFWGSSFRTVKDSHLRSLCFPTKSRVSAGKMLRVQAMVTSWGSQDKWPWKHHWKMSRNPFINLIHLQQDTKYVSHPIGYGL